MLWFNSGTLSLESGQQLQCIVSADKFFFNIILGYNETKSNSATCSCVSVSGSNIKPPLSATSNSSNVLKYSAKIGFHGTSFYFYCKLFDHIIFRRTLNLKTFMAFSVLLRN